MPRPWSHRLPSRSSQRSLARRALIEDLETDRRSWLRHGAAGLAVAALGLAVAGSVALTGNAANRAEPRPTPVATSTGVVPSAFDSRSQATSRDASRLPLDGETIDPSDAAAAQAAAAAKAQKQTGATSTGSGGASDKAAAKRTKLLESEQSKSRKLAAEMQVDKSSPNSASDSAATASAGSDDAGGKVSLPITSGYTVAARFGQVGPWARYHTGFDFACPIGTPIHAAADGVVTNAGPNGEAGWAGTYVTIRHADGTQTLYAHMANTTVSKGQHVTGGQVIGHVGMTGRSFGPHVHFEVYPAGVTPGDVYKAVDPAPWLKALGLNP